MRWDEIWEEEKGRESEMPVGCCRLYMKELNKLNKYDYLEEYGGSKVCDVGVVKDNKWSMILVIFDSEIYN